MRSFFYIIICDLRVRAGRSIPKARNSVFRFESIKYVVDIFELSPVVDLMFEPVISNIGWQVQQRPEISDIYYASEGTNTI